MRLAALPLPLVLVAALAAPGAAQMRSQPARIPGGQISINGTGQAGRADRQRYVVRPWLVVRNEGWREELRQVDRRIRQARESGEMTRGEARALRREVAVIWSLGNSYAAGGYSDSELYALESQAFALRDRAGAPNRPAAKAGR